MGLWNAEGDLSKVKTRIGGHATTHVVTTLAEAQEQVRLLIQPLLPPPEKERSRKAVHGSWREAARETKTFATKEKGPRAGTVPVSKKGKSSFIRKGIEMRRLGAFILIAVLGTLTIGCESEKGTTENKTVTTTSQSKDGKTTSETTTNDTKTTAPAAGGRTTEKTTETTTETTK